MSFLLSCLLLICCSHFSPLLFRLLLLSILKSHTLASQRLRRRTQLSLISYTTTFISLPNPNLAEQFVVFPSQSQIFRFPPTIFLFSFALSLIIFFPYPNPPEQTIVFPSQIFNLRL
ncbi:hypothetical protein ACB092_06G040500 [Castanea dentata]